MIYLFREYKRYRKPLEDLHKDDPTAGYLPKGDPLFLSCNESFVEPEDKKSKICSFKKGVALGESSYTKYVHLWFKPCGITFFDCPKPSLYSFRYNTVKLMLMCGLTATEIMWRTGHITLEGLKAYIAHAMQGEAFAETQAKIDELLK